MKKLALIMSLGVVVAAAAGCPPPLDPLSVEACEYAQVGPINPDDDPATNATVTASTLRDATAPTITPADGRWDIQLTATDNGGNLGFLKIAGAGAQRIFMSKTTVPLLATNAEGAGNDPVELAAPVLEEACPQIAQSVTATLPAETFLRLGETAESQITLVIQPVAAAP